MTRRQAAADDGVRAEVAALDVVEVHRAAVAVRAALHLPVELGHDRVRVRAARERVPVRAVGRARRRRPPPSPGRRRPRRPPGRSRRAGSPGSSPARNRSSTFSSKRRMRSISRRKSRSVSSLRARFFSTFATAPAVYVLRREPRRTVARAWQPGSPRAGAAPACGSSCGIAEPPTGRPRCSGRRSRSAPEPTRCASRRPATAARPAPTASRACCARLDDARIGGTLDARRARKQAPRARRARATTLLADVLGRRARRVCPSDWSDLLCEVDAALDRLRRARGRALHPDEPAPRRRPRRAALPLRARRAGYGVSPEMARRCLERCDAEDIRGSITVLRALSDTQLVATQGPVWHLDGQTV